MTAPAYLGAALCYDKSHTQLYKDACLAVNEWGNAWEIHGPPREFDCTGILMHNFYLDLVAGGQTNQCVCKFTNTGTKWAFAGHWGPCNGACVGKYKCNGNTPVSVSGKEADVEVEVEVEVGKRAPPSNATSSTSGSTSGNLAVPLAVSWKTMLCVAVVVLFNGIA